MTASSLGNCRTITVYHVKFCACCIKKNKSKCELSAAIVLVVVVVVQEAFSRPVQGVPKVRSSNFMHYIF